MVPAALSDSGGSARYNSVPPTSTGVNKPRSRGRSSSNTFTLTSFYFYPPSLRHTDVSVFTNCAGVSVRRCVVLMVVLLLSSLQASYRPFLRQLLEEVFHPDRPECPDVEHMSGGLTDLLKTGFSMFMKVSRHPPSRTRTHTRL